MLLRLDAVLKRDLTALESFDEVVLAEFAKMGFNYVKKGGKVGEKSIQSAATKLGIEPETVERAIKALSHTFSISASHSLDTADFSDSLLTAGLSPSAAAVLARVYEAEAAFLRGAVEIADEEESPDAVVPTYEDVEWRVQVEVGSRALRNQFIPSVLLKLKTTTSTDRRQTGGDSSRCLQSHLFEMSPRDLVHVTESLEDALRAVRSSHSRRLMRSLT